MKRTYEFVCTVGSGLIQAGTSILILKLNLANLSLNEVQVWVVAIALLPFYTLLEFGVTTVLPKKLTKLDLCMQARFEYLQSYINRAIILHVASVPLIFIFFSVLAGTKKIIFLDFWLLLLFSVTIATRAYSNITLGVMYSLGKNFLEKFIRAISSSVQLFIAYLLSNSYDYELINLLWLTLVTSFGTILCASYIISSMHKNVKGKVKIPFSFKRVCGDEADILKTTLPGMFVINSLPFLISILLNARDNVNYAFAQQIFAGLSIVALAPVSILYKKLTILFIEKVSDARKLMYHLVLITCVVSVVLQLIIVIGLDEIISFLNKDASILDKKFVIIFLALMSFEWIQGVMTRGAMAGGYFNFWRQTTASAVMLAILSIPFSLWFGLYGLIFAVFIAQVPTCHFFNIKISLEKCSGKFLDFIKYSVPYYLYLPIAFYCAIK